jgi:hypothetical protein
MEVTPPNDPAAVVGKPDAHSENGPERSVSFEDGPAIGAALAAHRLVELLDPKLIQRQQFKSIPGGLRLPNSGIDLIVSPIDAGLNGNFEMAELHQLASITGRTTVALRDEPTELTIAAVTAAPLPVMEIRNGSLWWYLFDPAFCVISGHPSSAMAWSKRTCLRLVPGGLPVIGPPPDIGRHYKDSGYRDADRIVRAWRLASLGRLA